MSETFGSAFHIARLNSSKTYREIGEACGLSIGYLCDIERRRKNPPEPEIVAKIEACLGITDGHLVALAAAERSVSISELKNWLKDSPKLQELMIIASNLEDGELDKLLERTK